MKLTKVLQAVVLGLFLSVAASAQQQATQPLTITVNASTLSITTTQATVPNAVVATAYSGASFQATGGVGPYTFNISSGTLPTGLSLSSAGVLAGTPTVAQTSNFTVRVMDSQSTPATATKSFTIIVYSKLNITTTVLPGGTLNQPYSGTVNFTGGVAPFVCSLSVGSLPTGLTLGTSGSTCTVTGTPTVVGSSNFTIQVQDNSVI